MAEQVKANTVVSIQHSSANDTSSFFDIYNQGGNTGKPKKEKKSKKVVRMAGGQTWEDTSLMDWEDGTFFLVYSWNRIEKQ